VPCFFLVKLGLYWRWRCIPSLFFELENIFLLSIMALTSEFYAALNQLCAERGLDQESVLEGIRQALVSAYHKDFPNVPVGQLRAEVETESGEIKIFDADKDVTPAGFGRIAAQTAKQVILQQIRETEKEAIRSKYQDLVGKLISGSIFRLSEQTAIIDLGRIQGILPPHEQIPNEVLRSGQHIRVLVKDVQEGSHGPQVILSRADPRFVECLFELEVPEIPSGKVVISTVAREAGSRTKIAVYSTEEGLDPVGSCVGQKGSRVREVMDEIGQEKIDIISYDDDPAVFIANALSPAAVKKVDLNKSEHLANVLVNGDQMSLAIGKGGQNVRLAAKLTAWKIDISSTSGQVSSLEEAAAQLQVNEATVPEEKIDALSLASSQLDLQDKQVAKEDCWENLTTRVKNALQEAGYSSLADLEGLSEAQLGQIKGIGAKTVEQLKSIIA